MRSDKHLALLSYARGLVLHGEQASAGKWSFAASSYNAIVSSEPSGDSRRDNYTYYGGTLVCESTANPSDMLYLLAAQPSNIVPFAKAHIELMHKYTRLVDGLADLRKSLEATEDVNERLSALLKEL